MTPGPFAGKCRTARCFPTLYPGQLLLVKTAGVFSPEFLLWPLLRRLAAKLIPVVRQWLSPTPITEGQKGLVGGGHISVLSCVLQALLWISPGQLHQGSPAKPGTAEAIDRVAKVERLWKRASALPGSAGCRARMASEVHRLLFLTQAGTNPKGSAEGKLSLARLLHLYNGYTPSHCPSKTAFQKQTF